ncbi:MAG: fumarate reductase subunit A [Euryarchaeota archaeon]|nr:fumarate reductase subunit A [Euryarchaeota archaeon]
MELVDDVYQCDVLVVGGGGAGARAAIEARKQNVDVLLVVKGLFGRSGCTVMAEGGYNAAFGFVDPEDSQQLHFEDTVIGGRFLNNQRLVEILVRDAPKRIIELEQFGAAFDRIEPEKFDQRYFGGQRFRRTVHRGDRTGHEMMSALKEEAYRVGVEVLEEVAITRLLTGDGRLTGATGLDLIHGRFLLFKAKAIVLATGGAGRLYSITTNPYQKTGDGYALAYNAGAELIDMEMVQFHPTGMVYPPSASGLLVTEAVRGEGGKLYNAKGERFMARYDPERMELSTRDVVTRAIFTEISQGRGTPNGGVYLDLTHVPDEVIEQKLGTMLKQFLDVGVDIRREPMEVSPSAHHFMGGVRTHEDCRSTRLRNLFACGEVNGGVHGANRLGGNSLAETQVFGAIAGKNAAEEAKRHGYASVPRKALEEEHDRIFRFESGEGVLPYEVRSRLQRTMWEKVGIVRSRQSLEEALREIAQLRSRLNEVTVEAGLRYNLQLLAAVELDNMLLVAEMIARSALLRTESRGAHFRSDYPEEDPRWVKNIVVSRAADGMVVKTVDPVITTLAP